MKSIFEGTKPMKGKELEILRKTASRLISETPTKIKEIKCYTCKYRNLDPVPEDLPCVDCWNEMNYVNYEKDETL